MYWCAVSHYKATNDHTYWAKLPRNFDRATRRGYGRARRFRGCIETQTNLWCDGTTPHPSVLKLYLFFFMVVAHVDSPCETKNAQTRGLMTNLEGLVSIVSRLRVERTNLVNQLRHVDAALSVLGKLGDGSSYSRPKSKISRRGRARIAAAQRARWAKVNGRTVVPIAKPDKRTMSASARRKIAAAQRARWAKVKREKKAA